MEDPNKNINTNDGYSFYSDKDDHGFNDNIYTTQASKTANILKIVVLASVGLITFIVIVFMFSRMLASQKERANSVDISNKAKNNIDYVINTKNRIFDSIGGKNKNTTQTLDNTMNE